MVEQWTENPCVPGSIPGGTTKPTNLLVGFLFKTLIFQYFTRFLINSIIKKYQYIFYPFSTQLHFFYNNLVCRFVPTKYLNL